MFKDFYDIESKPIITLEAFYGPKQNLVQKCLVILSKKIYEHMLERFACQQVGEIGACNGTIPIWTFECRGEEIAFYLTPIGSALAGGTLVEVNHITGANQFVMFGSCGSLDGQKTAGKFIVPTEAYRGEGLSYYYAPAQDYISIKKAQKLAGYFEEWEIPFVTGRVWTTDSMLRETANLVNKRKAEGCIAVEMELAGVQAVCDFHGFVLYDFLAAGDVLAEDDYRKDGLSDANHNLDKLEIALRILERI